MTERTARRLVRVLAAYLFVSLVVAIWLTAGDVTSSIGDTPFVALLAGGLTAFATIGLLIAAKAPKNPIGWLYSSGGLGMITGLAANEYAIRAATNLDVPGGAYAQFMSAVVLPISISALVLALLLFPTGSPPTRRWRIVVWPIAVATVVGVVGNAFVPSVFEAGLGVFVDNPLHLAILAPFDPLGGVWGVTMAVSAMVVFASVGVRFWRARGEERQQMRWLVFAVALTLVSAVVTIVSGGPVGEVMFVVTLLALFVGLPGATAIAILRYRLYDLDVVIKKTLIFAITVVLVMVVGLGFLLAISGPITEVGPDETVAVAFTFLAIGVLVWPLWRLARRIGDRLVYGGRATPYEALTEFSDRLSEAYATDDVLPRMAAVLGESTRAAEARVWLLVGGAFRDEAAWPSETPKLEVVRTTGDTLPSFPAVDHAVDVRHRGELLGALTTVSFANDPIDTGRLSLMRDLAAQAGIVLRNVRLIEELRASRQRLVAAQDEERRRLERDIHDGVQQQLVALTVQLRLAEQLVERDPDRAREMLTELQGRTTEALEDLRDLARGIYPPLLADEGLAVALSAQARKSPVPVTVESDGIGRYPPQVETAVYFSVLEALNNVAKYAGATRVAVSLEQRDGTLEFRVVDDGRGFDPGTTVMGSGLQGIADRLQAIGGELEIVSTQGQGTEVAGHVPTLSEPSPVPH